MKIGISKTHSKEVVLIKITCLSWAIAKGISYKLWLSDRLFPVIPPFDFTPNLPNPVHLGLFLGSLLGLFCVFVFTEKKHFIVLVLLTEMASCFLDQMRWQPWEYQYLLVFVFYLFYIKNTNHFLGLITFLMGVTYIYSGLHKFNGGFLYSIWEQMILKRFFNFPDAILSQTWIHYSGLLLAVIETTIGFGLLFLKKKRFAAYFAIMMHLIILLILVGRNQNVVVWPWNLTMLMYVFKLFLGEKTFQISLQFFKNKLNLVVFFVIGFLPFLCFFGLWDNYLSFNLYSGNVKQLLICVEGIDKYPELKPYVSKYKTNLYCNGLEPIDANKWAYKEMNVPLYPEERTFRKFKKIWMATFPNSESTFISYGYPYKNENKVEIQ